MRVLKYAFRRESYSIGGDYCVYYHIWHFSSGAWIWPLLHGETFWYFGAWIFNWHGAKIICNAQKWHDLYDSLVTTWRLCPHGRDGGWWIWNRSRHASNLAVRRTRNCSKKINTSDKVTTLNGVPFQIAKTDLQKELWIEGYESGDESELKRYSVSHDATIVESDGTEVQIAPVDVQFQSASLINRMLTNFAGPFNNFILAIVAFALFAFF